MRITDVHVDGFGVWSDLKVDDLPESITVFFGRNEAGKTTLMQFLRTVLYGFTTDRRQRYLPPVNGGRPGGSLRVTGTGGTFDVRRHAGLNGSGAADTLEIIRSDGASLGPQRLNNLLSDVDESIYNNVFAFGLRDLQELGTLDGTNAAELLYKLASGMDRVSLVDVMRRLTRSRNQLLGPDPRQPAEIADLIAERTKLQREVDGLMDRGRRWIRLAAQRAALADDIGQIENGLKQLTRDSRTVELALQIQDKWLTRDRTQEQVRRLALAVELPERASEQLEQLNAQLAERREQIEQSKRQCTRLREEHAALPIDRTLGTHASRIEALNEHLPWIESIERQIAQLQSDIETRQAEVEAPETRNATGSETLPRRLPEISRQARAALRVPARLLRDQTQRWEAARSEAEAAQREFQDVSRRLETELSTRGRAELASSLEETGSHVSSLRRRVQLDSRLDKMHRHLKELRDDRHELLEEQLLPVPKMFFTGAVFVFGVVMILLGVFSNSFVEFRPFMLFLGAGCIVAAIMIKRAFETSSEQELEDCERQLRNLEEQLAKSREERDDLDRSLPLGGGQLDSRLKSAEDELGLLEELMPIETQRKSVQQRLDAAQGQLAEANESLRAATERWHAGLRRLGLPEGLTPKHVRELATGQEQRSQVKRLIDSQRQELASRQAELRTIVERIEQLAEDVQLKAKATDARSLIRQLNALLAEQQQLLHRRRDLKRLFRQASQQFRRHTNAAENLNHRRNALFAAAGAGDESGFRELAIRQQRRLALEKECDELSHQIEVALRGQAEMEAVAHEIESKEEGSLEHRWDQLVSRMNDTQARLAGLHQRRGEINQEMKTLSEDRRMAEARIELDAVERRLEKATRDWRTLSVASVILESICRKYEAERQPETLNAASKYLHQMTDGRYQRIWTPLHDNALCIDGADGQSLPLEVLSRGTREAVFISLRLALVEAYGRRGVTLPLVLDDVLVNFDAARAQAAVNVLRDFARAGHQLMMFTCHEHIMQMFKAAKVIVRTLPARNGVSNEVELEEPVYVDVPAVEPEPAEDQEVVVAASQDVLDEEPRPEAADKRARKRPRPQPIEVVVEEEDFDEEDDSQVEDEAYPDQELRPAAERFEWHYEDEADDYEDSETYRGDSDITWDLPDHWWGEDRAPRREQKLTG